MDEIMNDNIIVWDTKTFESQLTEVNKMITSLETIQNDMLACFECFLDGERISERISLYCIVELEFKKVRQIDDPEIDTVLSMKALPNNLLAAGTWKGDIFIFDYKTLKRENKLKHGDDSICDLQYFDHEDLLLSCSKQAIFVWDYKRSNCIKRIEENETVYCTRVLPSKLYFVCSVGEEIKFYRRKTFECVSTVSRDVIQAGLPLKDLKVLDNDIFAIKTDSIIKVFDFKLKENKNA